MRKAWFVTALLMALPVAAQAQSIEQVFQSFGLIGVWASACNQPPSLEAGNSQSIYALSSTEDVMLTYDYGRPRSTPSSAPSRPAVTASPMSGSG
jgi:hypothetical protein